MKPSDFGLPQFHDWRPQQEEAIWFPLFSSKRFVAPTFPAGAGKSLVYVCQAVAFDGRTCILTPSRGLQDQLLKEYSSVGVTDIRGKANYQCVVQGHNCEEGQLARCPAKQTTNCPFHLAYIKCLLSKIVVTNYAFWTYAHLYGLGIGKFDLLILDEAQEAPDAIASAVQIRFGSRETRDLLDSNTPDSEDTLKWKLWARELMPRANIKLELLKTAIRYHSSLREIQEFHHMKSLHGRIKRMAGVLHDNWVVEPYKWGWHIDPIRVGHYAEKVLFTGIPKVIMTSATVGPKTLSLLGVHREEADSKEFPSLRRPGSLPIRYVPSVRVDFRSEKAGMLPQLFVCADQIMRTRLGRKGIIHTVSFSRRDQLVEASRYAEHMLTNVGGDLTSSVVEAFRRSQPPKILVSPSIVTGYDFPHDDCRWQILLKIPFPSSQSKLVKARQALDGEYVAHLAMQGLVQACLRGHRDPATDWCEVFILDSHCDWFLNNYCHLAPRGFIKQIRKVHIIPPPIGPLKP